MKIKFSVVFLLTFFIYSFVVAGQASAAGNSYYLSFNQGTDRADCSGGTATNPWKTWRVSKENGCFGPGDTVYIMDGTYEESQHFFEKRKVGTDNQGNPIYSYTKIDFFGTEGNPITIAAADGAHPIFRGFFMMDGEWGEVKNIEFSNDNSSNFHINGSHMTFEGNYIHSIKNGKTFDCVTIYTGKYPNVNNDIKFFNNEIHGCSEDCLDAPGAENLWYKGNEFHDCAFVQIKSGSENVLVEQNVFHNMQTGISSPSFSCSYYYEDILSCHGKDPTTDPTQRAILKNAVIRNNIFYNITGNQAIVAGGWKNCQIYNNTFYNVEQGAFQGINSTAKYIDTAAADYCAANPGVCAESCTLKDGHICYQIPIQFDNVEFRNNIVYDSYRYAFRLGSTITNFRTSHNIYYNSPGNPTVSFMIGGVIRSADSYFNNNIANFEDLSNGLTSQMIDPSFVNAGSHDFRLQANSSAINAGINLDFNNDYAGDTRPQPQGGSFDIGAFEYQGQTFQPTATSVPPTATPEATATPAPAGPQCLNIQIFAVNDMSTPIQTVQTDQTIKFLCGTDPLDGKTIKFRVKEERDADFSMDNLNSDLSDNFSDAYVISQAGNFIAQCAICDSNADNCVWE